MAKKVGGTSPAAKGGKATVTKSTAKVSGSGSRDANAKKAKKGNSFCKNCGKMAKEHLAYGWHSAFSKNKLHE